ncbi:hypothetical protein CAI21_02765 [Alkalilimnicola ehrlichii]|nr:hypothetical protein CAI21_02765 [Alkalilimnicola ehrlichii]
MDDAPYRSARNAAAADVRRLEALTDNLARQVERHRQMLDENFISASMYEESQAELRALQEQLQGARSRLETAERDLRNTVITAPLDGIVDQRHVGVGDFLQTGQPFIRLVSGDRLRIHLPFPETVATQLSPGLPVRLSAPFTPLDSIAGEIREIRPALSTGRAVEAIVEIDNPGQWRTGGSVRGTVVLAQRRSVMVPEAAVVTRPAGHTVYLVDGNRVLARQVTIGRHQNGLVEILKGLEAGQKIALDGAGFLTDGALVSIAEARP